MAEYRGDFGRAETLAQFEYFCEKAGKVFDLAHDIPPAPDGDGVVHYKDLAAWAEFWLTNISAGSN